MQAGSTPGEAPTGSQGRGPYDASFLKGALLLFFGVFALYFPSLGGDFAWLDQREIVEGSLIVDTWSEALALFHNDGNYAGYHRPMYNLVHSLDLALWGLNPFGFHLSSVLLHALVCVLIFACLRAGGRSVPFALAVGGLFGLHPVNTAVAGLIHSKADLLATASMLVAGLTAWEGWRRRSTSLWLLSLAAYAFGFLSKETALVYPVLVVVAAGFGARPDGARGTNRGYLVSLLALTAGLLFYRVRVAPPSATSDLALGERLATFLSVYLGYLRKLALPLDLSICDTTTTFSALSASAKLRVLVSFGCVLAAQVAAGYRFRVLRKWILLFNLSLLPVAQIVPTLHFRADRFLYLPSLAFVGALVESLRLLWPALPGTPDEDSKGRFAGTVGVLALVFALLVWQRLPILENDETLFTHEIARTPDYREGLSVLGRYYQQKGRFDWSRDLLAASLQEHPGRVSFINFGGAVLALSQSLLSLRKPHEALELIRSRAPEVPGADHRRELAFNLAVAHYQLGAYGEALPLFQQYRQERPQDAGCLFLLGMSAVELGERELARESLSLYLQLNPQAPDRPRVEQALAGLGGF